MCMASGWCEKKSAMRQPSWMWFLGLGFSACTMSGNFMPSRTKKTGKLLPTRSQLPSLQPWNDPMHLLLQVFWFQRSIGSRHPSLMLHNSYLTFVEAKKRDGLPRL